MSGDVGDLRSEGNQSLFEDGDDEQASKDQFLKSTKPQTSNSGAPLKEKIQSTVKGNQVNITQRDLESWMQDKEKKYKMINERILRACKEIQDKFPITLKRKTIKNFLRDQVFDPNHGLTYCRNAKVII